MGGYLEEQEPCEISKPPYFDIYIPISKGIRCAFLHTWHNVSGSNHIICWQWRVLSGGSWICWIRIQTRTFFDSSNKLPMFKSTTCHVFADSTSSLMTRPTQWNLSTADVGESCKQVLARNVEDVDSTEVSQGEMGIPRGRLTLLTVNKHLIDYQAQLFRPDFVHQKGWLFNRSERGILFITLEEKALKGSMLSELPMISWEYLRVINIVSRVAFPVKGGMTIQHLLHRAFWCKLLVENGTLQSDTLIFEILEISFATTNHLIPPPQKKARDPLIPNMSADWTPRFVHPLSAARCRWPSKLAKIWIPPS